MTSSIESFRLTVFRTVAEHLSFTQAAERLNLSQPAVTSHIKVIEEELAVRLFERSSGGIRLTLAGEKLFALEAQRMTEQALQSIGVSDGRTSERSAAGSFHHYCPVRVAEPTGAVCSPSFLRRSLGHQCKHSGRRW